MSKLHRIDLLRHVRIGDTGFRLALWDLNRTTIAVGSRPTHHALGYALFDRSGKVLFRGRDYGCPMHVCVDSDDALRSLLSFFTLTSDTDGWTQAQRDFLRTDAEELSLWATDSEELEPMPFEEC